MTRLAYATLTLLCLAGLAAAQVCHAPVVVHHAPVVHAAPVVKVVKEVVAVPVAVPVLVPAYGAVYVPPAVPAATPAPAAQQQSADLKAIADGLRAIDARLRSLEGRPAVPPATPPAAGAQDRPSDPFNPGAAPQAQTAPAGNALAIVQAKCAQCHSGTAEKGGGLVLVEGGTLSRLADKAGRKTIGAVYRGTMPPKSSGLPPLTDEEVSVLVSHYGQ